jgi:hypothetical protein
MFTITLPQNKKIYLNLHHSCPARQNHTNCPKMHLGLQAIANAKSMG